MKNDRSDCGTIRDQRASRDEQREHGARPDLEPPSKSDMDVVREDDATSFRYHNAGLDEGRERLLRG